MQLRDAINTGDISRVNEFMSSILVGVYSSESVIAGIAIHMLTAISIGTVVGIFLYKTGILNISKIPNGILYGLFAGSVVFVVFLYQYTSLS
jgi:hypothetical protein